MSKVLDGSSSLPFGPITYTEMVAMPKLTTVNIPKIDDFTIAITDYPPFTLKAKLDIHALNTLAFKETNSANLTVYNLMRGDLVKQYQHIVQFMWKVSVSGIESLENSIRDPQNPDVQSVPSPKKIAKYF